MAWWGWLVLGLAAAWVLVLLALLLLLYASRDAPPEREMKRRARRR